MRLIDAELIQYEAMLSAKGNGMYEDVMVAYESQIACLPTIEERKKGKWEVAIGYDPKRIFMCDQCRRMAYEPSAYCPNCGSYNGEGDDETDKC